MAAGYLAEQDIGIEEIAEPYIEDYENNAVVEARIANMLTDDIMLGLGVINSKEDYFCKNSILV